MADGGLLPPGTPDYRSRVGVPPGAPGPEAAWEVGWKVAPAWKRPEAEGPDSIVEASMKTTQQKQQKGLGAVGKAITASGACLTLACAGVPVRPEPPGEPCPPGAVETMARLNIVVGHLFTGAIHPGPAAQVVSVKEGWANVRLAGSFGELPPGAILKGRYLLGGTRVYGRFIQAQDREGTRSWPVCIEMRDIEGRRGLELEPGSTAETAKVYSTVEVKAVDRFE